MSPGSPGLGLHLIVEELGDVLVLDGRGRALLDEGGTCSTQGVDLVPELSRNGVRVQLDLCQMEK